MKSVQSILLFFLCISSLHAQVFDFGKGKKDYFNYSDGTKLYLEGGLNRSFVQVSYLNKLVDEVPEKGSWNSSFEVGTGVPLNERLIIGAGFGLSEVSSISVTNNSQDTAAYVQYKRAMNRLKYINLSAFAQYKINDLFFAKISYVSMLFGRNKSSVMTINKYGESSYGSLSFDKYRFYIPGIEIKFGINIINTNHILVYVTPYYMVQFIETEVPADGSSMSDYIDPSNRKFQNLGVSIGMMFHRQKYDL